MGKILELEDQDGDKTEVSLDINCYQNNGCIYIGLIDETSECSELYGDVTVNLDRKIPDYCGYIDTNNMPELEDFIVKNEIGSFTGLSQRSGFCEYPLYLFNHEKLRELCPEGMAVYEHAIGKGKIEE